MFPFPNVFFSLVENMPYFLLLPLSVCSLCMYAGKFCDTVEVVGRNVMSTTSVVTIGLVS